MKNSNEAESAGSPVFPSIRETFAKVREIEARRPKRLRRPANGDTLGIDIRGGVAYLMVRSLNVSQIVTANPRKVRRMALHLERIAAYMDQTLADSKAKNEKARKANGKAK